MPNYQITEYCHTFLKQQIHPGDLCIDATAGNSHDTLLLCRLTGPKGRVLAFDIQEQALRTTRTRLEKENFKNFQLFLESHTRMDVHCSSESASCIVFNFGYLPGGDHSLSTRASSSLEALPKALTLLKKGGLLSLCIYSGGDTGFEERDAILNWLSTLDPRRFLAIVSSYYNRPNNPPIPVLIYKL